MLQSRFQLFCRKKRIHDTFSRVRHSIWSNNSNRSMLEESESLDHVDELQNHHHSNINDKRSKKNSDPGHVPTLRLFSKDKNRKSSEPVQVGSTAYTSNNRKSSEPVHTAFSKNNRKSSEPVQVGSSAFTKNNRKSSEPVQVGRFPNRKTSEPPSQVGSIGWSKNVYAKKRSRIGSTTFAPRSQSGAELPTLEEGLPSILRRDSIVSNHAPIGPDEAKLIQARQKRRVAVSFHDRDANGDQVFADVGESEL